MSRVFWDAMLLIYLLEDHEVYAPVVRTLLARSYQRGDSLVTSYLALAETLVGFQPGSTAAETLTFTLDEMGFTLVPFDKGAVEPFRLLRRQFGLRAPDAMHLACAAAAKVDLFLTGDNQLLSRRLHIPGIHFIASFENPPL